MRHMLGTALVVTALVATAASAQQQAGDASRKVAGGGISVAGWQGTIDAKEAAAGATLNDAKLADIGGGALHVVTGPAVTYWSAANKASGDYTVRAKFHEPAFMALNSHAHPYGIMMAGNDLGTENQSYLYCAAYGDGRFIVRGMGPTPFQLNGRGAAHESVAKAAEKGKEVLQDIAMSVKGDKVSCAINGKEVWTAAKADVVGAGKLKSTDGVYGVRFGHNTEAHIVGLAVTKP
jgi:hypothetical protein